MSERVFTVHEIGDRSAIPDHGYAVCPADPLTGDPYEGVPIAHLDDYDAAHECALKWCTLQGSVGREGLALILELPSHEVVAEVRGRRLTTWN